MTHRAAVIASIVILALFAGKTARSQVLIQPTPLPAVTAENEPWYLNGDPITYAGNVYYPAGAEIFFSPNEMVRSGFYMGVPLYARTTIEPYSVVFVPLAGGRMQPYERPRSGELAGTAGSTPTTLPTPAGTVPPAGLTAQAAGAPSQTTRVMPLEVAPSTQAPVPPAGMQEAPRALGTAGRLPSSPRQAHTRIGGRPQGTNAIFIELHDSRWYPMGPAEPIDASRMVRIDDYMGFGVWTDRVGSSVIYIPVIRGGILAVPYTRTRQPGR